MISLKLILGSLFALTLAAASSVYLFSGNAGAIPFLSAVFNVLVAERNVSITRDVAYGPGERQKLDIYRPRASTTSQPPQADNGPIALFLYGGSWRQGERSQYEFVGRALARKGITTIIPDYRLYPDVKFPAFMDDAADAYAWVARTLAKTSAGNPRPIVLIGHSAGAHMAALLVLDKSYLAARGAELPPPSGLIGIAGPYSFDPTTWPSTKDVFASVTDPNAARPVAFAKDGGPPTLLMHGLDDQTTKISNTRDLARALKSAGTAVHTLEFADLSHVSILLAIAKPLRGWAPVLQAMREFMIRYAGLPPEPAGKPSSSPKIPVLPGL